MLVKLLFPQLLPPQALHTLSINQHVSAGSRPTPALPADHVTEGEEALLGAAAAAAAALRANITDVSSLFGISSV